MPAVFVARATIVGRQVNSAAKQDTQRFDTQGIAPVHRVISAHRPVESGNTVIEVMPYAAVPETVIGDIDRELMPL